MKIKWWGHACFAITSRDGTVVLTDPYDPKIGYSPITDRPDVVTISHQHWDHNASDQIAGSPVVITAPGQQQAAGLSFTGIASFHDDQQGQSRGSNVIFAFGLDNWRIVHLGDLGAELSQEQLDGIGRVDVLFVPVGGHFTIDANQAARAVAQLAPAIVIPMHYKTSAVDFPIAPVSSFTDLFSAEQVVLVEEEESNFAVLPDHTTVYVLPFVGQR